MKNVYEMMAENNTAEKIAEFQEKQKYPYEIKVEYARRKAEEFAEECARRMLAYHVSVGGLDSITLLLFLRKIGINPPAVSVSLLEDASIQKIHRELGVIGLLPVVKEVTEDGRVLRWTKPQIIQEFGFPVISKEVAAKIELLQSPTEKNKTVRHAIITGETGEYGGWQTESKMQLKRRWLESFGGWDAEGAEAGFAHPDFKVSSKCCYYLKEKPADDWAKEHNSVPYLGLMASEGGRREKSLKMHGCNYFGKSTIRSCPFAIFNRQDILQLALDLEVPIPSIYGTIERRIDGTLYTTKAQRTGCSMCGFGIHMEKRPHRFDLLYERNPKEWDYWMNQCCVDEHGERFGWGRVLDYIGVGWRPETLIYQITLDDYLNGGDENASN